MEIPTSMQVRKYASTQVKLFLFIVATIILSSSSIDAQSTDFEYHLIMDSDSLSLKNQILSKKTDDTVLDLKLIMTPDNGIGVKDLELLIPIIQEYNSQINFNLIFPVELNSDNEIIFQSWKDEKEIYEFIAVKELYPEKYLNFLHSWCIESRESNSNTSLLFLSYGMDQNVINERIAVLKTNEISNNFRITTFLETISSRVFLDNRLLYSPPEEVKCCDFTECMKSLLPSLSLSSTISFFQFLKDHKECVSCIKSRNPLSKSCTDCFDQLSEDVVDVIKAILDCKDDPCNSGGLLDCSEGQICNQKTEIFSILGYGDTKYVNGECLDCPTLSSTELGIQYNHPQTTIGDKYITISVTKNGKTSFYELKNSLFFDFQNDESIITGATVCVKILNPFCDNEECFTKQDPCEMLGLFLNSETKDPSECGACDGSIKLTLSGSSGLVTYSLNGNLNSTGIFENLCGGNYNISAVYVGTSCGVTFRESLLPFQEPNVTLSTISSCIGQDNGKIIVENHSGQPIQISPSNLVNLEPGNYTITISTISKTGIPICSITEQITVNEQNNKPLEIVLDPKNIIKTCGDNNNGSVSFSIKGGAPPYKVFINYDGFGGPIPHRYTSNYFVDNLGEIGHKKIIVTDQCGGYAEKLILIPDGSFNLDGTFSNSCVEENGNDISNGSITLTLSGGPKTDIPYRISWARGNGSPHPPANKTITHLDAGSYSVEVTDKYNHCKANATYVLSSPPCENNECTIKVINSTMIKPCTSDNPICSGIIEISVPHGATIQWAGLSNPSQSNNNKISGLCPGSYTVTVSLGDCIDTKTILLECCDNQDLLISGPANSSEKSISPIISGANGTVTYLWSGPNNYKSTSKEIRNLENGEYCLDIFDSCSETRKCFKIENCSIVNLELNGESTDACVGLDNGKIKISIIGDNDPFYIKWNNGMAGKQFDNLSTGEYCVTITDESGCDVNDCWEIKLAETTIRNEDNPCRRITICNGEEHIENFTVTENLVCNTQYTYCPATQNEIITEYDFARFIIEGCQVYGVCQDGEKVFLEDGIYIPGPFLYKLPPNSRFSGKCSDDVVCIPAACYFPSQVDIFGNPRLFANDVDLIFPDCPLTEIISDETLCGKTLCKVSKYCGAILMGYECKYAGGKCAQALAFGEIDRNTFEVNNSDTSTLPIITSTNFDVEQFKLFTSSKSSKIKKEDTSGIPKPKKNKKQSTSISPNPFENTIDISFDNCDNSNIKIHVVNILGELIPVKILNSNRCKSQIIFSKDIPNGIYFISILQQNKLINTHKIIKS